MVLGRDAGVAGRFLLCVFPPEKNSNFFAELNQPVCFFRVVLLLVVWEDGKSNSVQLLDPEVVLAESESEAGFSK